MGDGGDREISRHQQKEELALEEVDFWIQPTARSHVSPIAIALFKQSEYKCQGMLRIRSSIGSVLIQTNFLSIASH